MKIFFSYSGDLSFAVARIVREWLKEMLPTMEPFMAPETIEPGSIWLGTLASALQNTTAGLIFVTRENMNSTWLHYEAGAIAKAVGENARVIPVLIDVSTAELRGPLSHLQALRGLEKDDVSLLVETLNKFAVNRMRDDWWKSTFQRLWPDLEHELDLIGGKFQTAQPKTTDPVQEMLARILSEVRQRPVTTGPVTPPIFYGGGAGHLTIVDPSGVQGTSLPLFLSRLAPAQETPFSTSAALPNNMLWIDAPSGITPDLDHAIKEAGIGHATVRRESGRIGLSWPQTPGAPDTEKAIRALIAKGFNVVAAGEHG